MVKLLALVLTALCLSATMFAPANPTPETASFDVYITVGKGRDGEGGPVPGAQVSLVSPDGKTTQTKRSDDEGAVRFTVSATGRYMVRVTAAEFDPYEGRVIVDGSDPQIFHLAVLVPAKVQDAVLIRVRVKDDETGLPIEGASVETESKVSNYADHMTTGADGEAVVRVPFSKWTRNTDYRITVSHSGYAPWLHLLRADNRSNQSYSVDANLVRDKELVMVAITVLEEGTRAPILGARVYVDSPRDKHSQTTQPGGTAIFRVKRGAKYDVKITTDRYEEYTDSIDLISPDSPSVSPTYLLIEKQGAREIRRALLVWVKFKDKKGNITPGKDVAVVAPGLHSAATDEQGRIVFLHKVPPGETITATATHLGYKPASNQVTVRDKGVMVDLRQFSRDTQSMGDYEAVRKQGITGYDTMTITLEEEWLTKFKVTGKIESDAEADPGESLSYSTELTLGGQDVDDLTVEEVVLVTGPAGFSTRSGGIRALNAGDPSSKSYSFTPSKAGTYRIRSTVTFEGDVLWTGEKTVRVAENRLKATVSGSVVPKKGLVKLDEPVNVGVNVLYESGPTPDLRVSETVELFDPKGSVVQNNFSHRNLKRAAYSERNFNIVCQAPGAYRLRSTIRDESGQVLWTGEGGFTVDKTGKSAMTKGTGYFRLKNKVVGKAPGPAEGPYGITSGSISESSFSCQYQGKPPYEAQASVQIQWSVPPAVIKPNDSVELTVTASASVSGKDMGSFGASGGWGATGSASVVEGRSVFAGRGSDGKDYPSGSGKFKIVVGAGGSFKIFNGHIGALWGTSENWTPCTYEYEWIENAAPPKNDGKTTMNAGVESTVTADRNAYTSNTVTFGSFGTFSLQLRIGGRDFSGSGKSKDGKSTITLYGAVQANGKLTGSGALNRNGTKYTITVTGQRNGNVVVGEMSVKAAKGVIKGQFRLQR